MAFIWVADVVLFKGLPNPVSVQNKRSISSHAGYQSV